MFAKDKKMKCEFYAGLAEVKKAVMLLVAILAGHGVFDIRHYRLLTNPNLPVWLAALWIVFDLLKTAFRTWRGAKQFGFQGA